MTIHDFAELLTALASAGALLVTVYNAIKIKEVHRSTNGLKDELVAEVRVASHAAGVEEGRKDEKLRVGVRAAPTPSQ